MFKSQNKLRKLESAAGSESALPHGAESALPHWWWQDIFINPPVVNIPAPRLKRELLGQLSKNLLPLADVENRVHEVAPGVQQLCLGHLLHLPVILVW